MASGISPDSCTVCWIPLVIIIFFNFGAACLCVGARVCIYTHECLHVYDLCKYANIHDSEHACICVTITVYVSVLA